MVTVTLVAVDVAVQTEACWVWRRVLVPDAYKIELSRTCSVSSSRPCELLVIHIGRARIQPIAADRDVGIVAPRRPIVLGVAVCEVAIGASRRSRGLQAWLQHGRAERHHRLIIG